MQPVAKRIKTENGSRPTQLSPRPDDGTAWAAQAARLAPVRPLASGLMALNQQDTSQWPPQAIEWLTGRMQPIEWSTSGEQPRAVQAPDGWATHLAQTAVRPSDGWPMTQAAEQQRPAMPAQTAVRNDDYGWATRSGQWSAEQQRPAIPVERAPAAHDDDYGWSGGHAPVERAPAAQRRAEPTLKELLLKAPLHVPVGTTRLEQLKNEWATARERPATPVAQPTAAQRQAAIAAAAAAPPSPWTMSNDEWMAMRTMERPAAVQTPVGWGAQAAYAGPSASGGAAEIPSRGAGRLYAPGNRLTRWTSFEVDRAAGVYLYVGLDPMSDFDSVAHLAVGPYSVTLTTTDLGMLTFSKEHLLSAMDVRGPRIAPDGGNEMVFHGLADTVVTVVFGEPVVLTLANRFSMLQGRPVTVQLTRAQLVGLFALKDAYERAFVRLERKVRPAVRAQMDEMVRQFRIHNPGAMPEPRTEDMAVLYNRVIENENSMLANEERGSETINWTTLEKRTN